MEKVKNRNKEKSRVLVGQESKLIEVWKLELEGLRRGHPFLYTKTERKCIYPDCHRTFAKKDAAKRHANSHLKDKFSNYS
jgi:hypothetical protein